MLTTLLKALAGAILWAAAGVRHGVRELAQVFTLRRLAVAYALWLAVSLALFIAVGHLFSAIWAALVLWVGIGALAPLLLLPPGKRVIFAILGIVFAGVILKMTGVDPRFIGVITILVLGVIFVDHAPVPTGVRSAFKAGLVIALIMVPLLGGIHRTLPGTTGAMSLIGPTLDQRIADALGGGPLFDPITGEPRAKYNPATGEVFSHEQAKHNYDPRTGDRLEWLTKDKLQELQKAKARSSVAPPPAATKETPPDPTRKAPESATPQSAPDKPTVQPKPKPATKPVAAPAKVQPKAEPQPKVVTLARPTPEIEPSADWMKLIVNGRIAYWKRSLGPGKKVYGPTAQQHEFDDPSSERMYLKIVTTQSFYLLIPDPDDFTCPAKNVRLLVPAGETWWRPFSACGMERTRFVLEGINTGTVVEMYIGPFGDRYSYVVSWKEVWKREAGLEIPRDAPPQLRYR